MENTAINEHKIFYETDDLHLIHGDCLNMLDMFNAEMPEGFANMIFADPPYFLSNGGVTCHAGKMVSVNKGKWDKSKGAELNHAFNLEWLRRCRDALVQDGTIWISGTHHVIHSIGFAAQQLDMKIINSITWQKPNPPPNLACRCFTHSTETILWIAKSPKSRHTFHYQDMKRENEDKQMKDVWQFTAPTKKEKKFGKHPAQKPIALLERIIRASTNPGDVVLDPFNGSGSTGIAAMQTGRQYIGIEQEQGYCELSALRFKALKQATEQ